MKLKKLFSVLAVTLFGAAAIGAGFAKSVRPKVEQAKAEEANTWMVRFQINLGEASPHDPESEFTPPVIGMKFHYWGDGGVDNTVDAGYMFNTFGQDIYGVNVSLKDSETINGAQWIMVRQGEDVYWSYSVDITDFGAFEAGALNKDTTYAAIYWQYSGSWEGDKFEFYSNYGLSDTKINLEWQGGGVGSFTKNPSKNVFEFSSFGASETHSYIGVQPISAPLGEKLRLLLTPASKKYVVPSTTENTLTLVDLESHYYFALGSNTFEIKKHDVIEDSYIYFVSESDAQDDTLRAYTFGYNESHGTWDNRWYVTTEGWPGMDFVAPAYGLKFQGREHNVYRLPIQFGDFDCDTHIIFTSSEGQSANLLIQPGAAYWMGSPAESFNELAGRVLDVFYDLQNALKEVSPYGEKELASSVCALSAEKAGELYDAYDSFSADEKETWFASSSIFTYVNKDSDTIADRSAKDVFTQLGVLAGRINTTGRYISDFGYDANSSTIIIITSVFALISITSISVLLIAKKRKTNK